MMRARVLAAVAAVSSGLTAFGGGFGALGAAWGDEVDLATAKVFVSTNATVPEVEAAKLLMRAQIMVAGGCDTTDVTPAVAAEWPKEGVVIGWQESALLRPFAKELTLHPWREVKNLGDEIVQARKGRTYVLAGNSPAGAYFSVADLLYRNGARFLHLGTFADGYEGGTFLEWMKGLKAPASRKYVPYVANRTGFSFRPGRKPEPEKVQIAMNQYAVRNCTMPDGPMNGGHARGSIGCESIQPPVALYKVHPEWFPLVDGERWRPANGGWITEGCWTCPGFSDWVVDNVAGQFKHWGGPDKVKVLNLTNSDGGPKCQCENCKKYRAQFPDDSSWYWDYHAKLAKRIEEKVPGLYRYTFAYIHSLCFPKAGKKAVEHLDAIQYCPYQRCYIHPYSDKTCKTNRSDMDRAEAWREAGIPIGDFDYCFDVFHKSMNMPSWEITWDVVRYWKELNGDKGVPSIYMEGAAFPDGCGGKSRISAYTVARALWDAAEAPAETHLRDYCRCGFGDPEKEAFAPGSAEAVMLDWYHRCARAWSGQKAHLTSTFNNANGTSKTYFTEELATTGEKAFAAAEAQIRARLAPEGTPKHAKLTRAQALAKKQLATLQWEKRVAYDEWKKRRAKAMATSLEVNVEEGEPSDVEFERVPPIPFNGAWGLPDATHSTAQVYRTSRALRIRITARNENFKPEPRTAAKGDDGEAYRGNHIELFVQAPNTGDYYHLCVGASGRRYDALCKDSTFNSDAWTSEIVQKPGCVQYTVTIPWTLFGKDFKPKGGEIFKLLAVSQLIVPDGKGGEKPFAAGLPRVSYHDVAVGADLKILETTGRRAGGK